MPHSIEAVGTRRAIAPDEISAIGLVVVSGKQHGRGFFTTGGKNASTYDGFWRAGMKHGKGVAKSGDGNVYDGEWCNNIKQVSATTSNV